MKTLYLDCAMGAAGDMLAAALLELLPEPEKVLAELNGLGIPGVVFRRESVVRCGVAGTALRAEAAEEHRHKGHGAGHEDHGHRHFTLGDVAGVIRGLPLGEKVRTDALGVYELIAGAEGAVHGESAAEVRFHEVGRPAAVAAVVAVCFLMDRLAPDKVAASPICAGTGHVRCAHGLLPVPAPAAAELLKGIPWYGGEKEGELCTPTGAALLRYFAGRFGEQPPMAIRAEGHGMGTKDLGWAGCVRALLGDDDGPTL